MNHDLKLRPKLTGGGGHLGAQKGAQAGPLEAPDWSPYLYLWTLPDKLRLLDYVNRKEGPT
jgi:hypothetical protein